MSTQFLSKLTIKRVSSKTFPHFPILTTARQNQQAPQASINVYEHKQCFGGTYGKDKHILSSVHYLQVSSFTVFMIIIDK